MSGRFTAALTPRQLEVAARLAVGATNREIAAELGISVKTVDTFRLQILTRLGVRNNVELARLAIAEGFVSLPGVGRPCSEDADADADAEVVS